MSANDGPVAEGCPTISIEAEYSGCEGADDNGRSDAGVHEEVEECSACDDGKWEDEKGKGSGCSRGWSIRRVPIVCNNNRKTDANLMAQIAEH